MTIRGVQLYPVVGTTTTGLHLKALTTAERDAMSPVAGDMIWNLDGGPEKEGAVEVYNGGTWRALFTPLRAQIDD